MIKIKIIKLYWFIHKKKQNVVNPVLGSNLNSPLVVAWTSNWRCMYIMSITRIFLKGGSHCVKQRVLTKLSFLTSCCVLFSVTKKGLQGEGRGGGVMHTPGPLLTTLLNAWSHIPLLKVPTKGEWRYWERKWPELHRKALHPMWWSHTMEKILKNHKC